MKFGGIVKSSTLDFPGKLCCVLFVLGCDLDCFYCHNRGLIDGSLQEMESGEIMSFLQKRKGLLDGVVISGGEPTIYPDLIDFIKLVKKIPYAVKLDTNGQRPEVVEKIAGDRLADYFAVDYKASLEDYFDVCGDSGEKVLKSIDVLLRSNADFEVRTTIYPGLGIEGLFKIASELPKLSRYRINMYKSPITVKAGHAGLLKKEVLTQGELEQALEKIKKIQPNTVLF